MENTKLQKKKGDTIKPGSMTTAYLYGELLSILFGVKKSIIQVKFSRAKLSLQSPTDVSEFIKKYL